MGMDPERAESVGAGDRGTVRWYCVQTRPKSEHIAAAGLARFDGVEAYCPRIRYQKVTRRGKVWFREALFPNYIFARFDAEESLRAVSSSQAVVRVVGFGDVLGEVPAAVIGSIREEMGGELEREVQVPIVEGEEVEVVQGPFAGMKGIVTGLVESKERVRILMEILGQENQVEVPSGNLRSDALARDVIAKPD